MSEKKSDNYIEVVPNAAKLLAALRELGYHSVAAICDLIDNSISAGADKIVVTMSAVGNGHMIQIVDNGRGMSGEQLVEAMRLGSDVRHKRDDLGKYGMGLKTAGLSVARRIYVLTREAGQQAWEATLDTDIVEREEKFLIEHKRAVKNVELLKGHGTLVRLTDCDRLDDTNVTRFNETMVRELGRVYRYYLGKGLRLTVGDVTVTSSDPLLRSHPGTVTTFEDVIDLGRGNKARLTVVELPDLGPVEDQALGIRPMLSGFYIVRNNREIAAAQTLGFHSHHHTGSHFRAELRFATDMDDAFHVDIRKSSITPNDRVLEKIKLATQTHRIASRKKGQERAIKKGRGQGVHKPPVLPIDFKDQDLGRADVLFSIGKVEGRPVVQYNTRHPIMLVMADLRDSKAHKVLDYLCGAIALSIAGNADLLSKYNSVLETLLAAGTDRDTWAEYDKTHLKEEEKG